MFWRDLKTRELLGEVMDDPSLPEPDHMHALQGLRRINALSGTTSTFWRLLLARLGGSKTVPRRVLDVACGDGDNAMRLAQRVKQDGLPWRIDGCDISERAVRRANESASASGVQATFFQADALNGLPTADYDAVINSLFLHHLEDEQIIALLDQLRSARHVIISDLVRGVWPYVATYTGVRLLSRSWVVHRDGPLSVRAALTPSELRPLAERASLSGATVRRCWPMRQLLLWSAGS